MGEHRFCKAGVVGSSPIVSTWGGRRLLSALANSSRTPSKPWGSVISWRAMATWIGNSAAIAAKHHLQVTDADFDRASQGGAESGVQVAQNRAQHAHAGNRTDSQEMKQALAVQGLVLHGADSCDLVYTCPVPPRGVEPLSSD